MISTIFKALQDRLAEVDGVKWVDFYNHQLRKQSKNELVTPAILIDFGTINWETLPRGLQEGEAEITFWVITQVFARSYRASSNRDKALEPFQLLEAIHHKLQGFSGDLFSALDRSETQTDNDHDQFLVMAMSYETKITDSSGVQQGQLYALPDIDVSGDLLERPR